MGSKLNQTHIIAIALSVVVVAFVLYMLVKIAGKRVNINGGRIYKNRRHANKNVIKHCLVLPEFPYGTLLESFIQPEPFTQTLKVIIKSTFKGSTWLVGYLNCGSNNCVSWV